MHELIERKRTAIADLCHRYKVRRLEAFGSAARGDDFDPQRSDADFRVEFAPDAMVARPLQTFFGLQAALTELLEKIDRFSGIIRNPQPVYSLRQAVGT